MRPGWERGLRQIFALGCDGVQSTLVLFPLTQPTVGSSQELGGPSCGHVGIIENMGAPITSFGNSRQEDQVERARTLRIARIRRTSMAAIIAMFAIATRGESQEGQIGTGGVRGTVRDSLGLPIAGAEISIAGVVLRAETDDRGEFLLGKAAAGSLSMTVRRIGFKPATHTSTIEAGKTSTADIVLQRIPIVLRPVVVMGKRVYSGRMAGFYQRRDKGLGHFVTREQIERRNPSQMTDIMRMIPGVRIISRGIGSNTIRIRGSRCAPLTWLDGFPLSAGEFDLDAIAPSSLEGMEVYSGMGSLPSEFTAARSAQSMCGTIVLWSKQGELRPKKRKGPSAASEIARLVDSLRIFTAEQVDVPAREDSLKRVLPIYPDSLFNAKVGGDVLVEFIVLQDGEVDIESFNVVTATNLAFVEAVRRALRDASYQPAVRQGRAVQQVVQQSYRFVPDSVARRR